VDIKAYIESGVIESYVLGMADAQEAAELEQLSRQYPEIRKAIDDFELNLEKQSLAGAVMPSPEVKKQLLATLDFEKEEKARVVGFDGPLCCRCFYYLTGGQCRTEFLFL
jgi:anti-sigma-K factor RskA